MPSEFTMFISLCVVCMTICHCFDRMYPTQFTWSTRTDPEEEDDDESDDEE